MQNFNKSMSFQVPTAINNQPKRHFFAKQNELFGQSKKINSDKKPRVCFTTVEFPPDLGGVSKSAGRITQFLKEAGYEVHVFAPCRQESVELFARITPVDIDGIYLYRIPVLSSYRDRYPDAEKVHYLEDMAQFIWSMDRKLNFDIFHGFFLHMADPCIKVAKGRPVIASVRGMDAKNAFNKLYSKEATNVLKRANWITSVSSDSLSELNEIVDISTRSGFLANSIGLPSDNTEWQLSNKNKGCVGTVCTFRPKKNIPLLIESYAKVNKNLRSQLLLVGDFITSKVFDEKASNECQAIIDKHGINEDVLITGMVNNDLLAPYYKSMNVFVISSNSEGLPNTLLEAASYGVPIVATKVDGMKDVIIDGENGLLVPPGDSVAMTRAIDRILRSPTLARHLSKGAYRLAEECSLGNEKQKWLEIYKAQLNWYQSITSATA